MEAVNERSEKDNRIVIRTDAYHVSRVEILVVLELRGELLLGIQDDVVDRELDLGQGRA